MDRETKTIITPEGKDEIVINTYITGREQREINGALYEKSDVEVVDGQPVIKNLNTKEIVEAIQNKTIETVIVSINGKQENILETILNMRARDYDFVVQSLNEITSGKKKA